MTSLKTTLSALLIAFATSSIALDTAYAQADDVSVGTPTNSGGAVVKKPGGGGAPSKGTGTYNNSGGAPYKGTINTGGNNGGNHSSGNSSRNEKRSERIRVERDAEVCFYSEPEFRGRRFCSYPGTTKSRLVFYWNDKISSIRVKKASAKVCADKYFDGKCADITKSLPRLEKMDDMISSLIVR